MPSQGLWTHGATSHGWDRERYAEVREELGLASLREAASSPPPPASPEDEPGAAPESIEPPPAAASTAEESSSSLLANLGWATLGLITVLLLRRPAAPKR